MVDLRVQQTDSSAERARAVSRDGGGSSQQPGDDDAPRHRDAPAGAEELAIALAESDRGDALTARYEVDSEGGPLIRIIDRTRNETVALITPEELKTLAEDTGLPPGLLVRVSS